MEATIRMGNKLTAVAFREQARFDRAVAGRDVVAACAAHAAADRATKLLSYVITRLKRA